MSRYILENGGLNEEYELDARHGMARRLRCRTMGEWQEIWSSLTGNRGLDEHTFWAQWECTTMKTAIGRLAVLLV